MLKNGVWIGNFDKDSAADLTAEQAATVVAITGGAHLCDYQHPLPLLAHICGSADLRGYAHPLPLLAHIGGWAYLRDYAHPLPLLAHIGSSAYLRDYAHPLPEGCVVEGDTYR